VIRVKGGEDERLTVRISRHGPIISDVLPAALRATPRGHALALAWTALQPDDVTMQAALKLARARDWPSFLEAARDFHAPQQNVIYADVDGNIGFIAAGRVPVRKRGNELKGLAPAPGWDARYDWDGYVPFEELPRSFNPAGGSIVNANHKIVPSGYPHHITYEWQPPFRARRIAELLAARSSHDLSSFARIQGDVLSLAVREMLPKLLRIKPASADARRALDLLAKWDGVMSADRPEPLIAVAWWRALARAVYADELGEAFRQNWAPRGLFMLSVLENADGEARWCDDVRTGAVETCEATAAAALQSALAELKARYGADMARWRWGEAHAAHHRHRPLSRSRWLAPWFDVRVPSPGDAFTVNVGQTEFGDEADPYASRHAASLRALYDLSDLQSSLFIHSAGQSGNVLSPHYKAFADAWARGEYIPMVTNRTTLEAAKPRILVLKPG
jgi:penicillin amidase